MLLHINIIVNRINQLNEFKRQLKYNHVMIDNLYK